MSYKIYHNPRCGKSREGLALLKSLTDEIEIIDYLKNPPSIDEMKTLLQQLGIEPIGLVRTQESIWKEKFKGKNLSNTEIINALIMYPKLIERPIIVRGNSAIIGRPIENINIFLR